MGGQILALYRSLLRHFGPQHWWPAQSRFEVIVGAILTQNTSWVNVERAIRALRAAHALSCAKLARMPRQRLACLIRPTGYYNLKAQRLQTFLDYFCRRHQGSLRRMAACETKTLRQELLAVRGIGPETADSILLYALDKPVFVIDAYTRRILDRHRLVPADASYDQAQAFFTRALPADARLFNEFHALLVRLAKEHCLKTNPRCDTCPLQKSPCHHVTTSPKRK